MANVVNKATSEYRKSVNTPDYPAAEWLIDPDVSALAAVPQKYWKVSEGKVVEMSAAEKTAVDAAATTAQKATVPVTLQLRSPNGLVWDVSVTDLGVLATAKAV